MITPSWTAEFRTRAILESLSTDATITDPKILKLCSNIGVLGAPPLRSFGGGVRVLALAAKLVPATGGLEFVVSVGLGREPSADEIKKLCAACDALLYTHWGLNLEFDLPDDPRLDDVHIQLSDGFAHAPAAHAAAAKQLVNQAVE